MDGNFRDVNRVVFIAASNRQQPKKSTKVKSKKEQNLQNHNSSTNSKQRTIKTNTVAAVADLYAGQLCGPLVPGSNGGKS